jgi:hypothetical protein
MTARKTREQWLQQATTALRADFRRQGATVPDVYVSTGWPKGGRGKVIGQCFPASMVADSKPAVFVTPALDDSLAVLAVLAHELVHATVGTACGHKGPFRTLALAVGLEGPMTATHAGAALQERFRAIVARIGDYPSARVNAAGRRKQGIRMLKLECMAWDGPDGEGEAGCGMLIRTTRKWLEDIGAPRCACGGQFQEA